MANQHIETYHSVPWGSRALYALASAFSKMIRALSEASEANRRMTIVQYLNEKSDAELAQLGIRRQDIVRRVFVDKLDV